MTARENAISYVVAGTAASSFHVSDTLDWSCVSAQTKNRVVIVEVPVMAPERVEPADSICPSDQASGATSAPVVDVPKR